MHNIHITVRFFVTDIIFVIDIIVFMTDIIILCRIRIRKWKMLYMHIISTNTAFS